MATGGLRDCPKCKQPVRDADWLQGVCTGCGYDFGRMDTDELAEEIERQRAERERLGYSPAIRGFVVGAGIAVVLAMWIADEMNSPALSGKFPTGARLILSAVIPASIIGYFAGIGACAAAQFARKKKWSSLMIWVAAFIGGILPVPMLYLFLLFILIRW